MLSSIIIAIIIIIFLLGLIPGIVSWWIVQKNHHRITDRIRSRPRNTNRTTPSFLGAPLHDYHYIEGVGYVIGDITCEYNAKSPLIRCAVNPHGPCQDCSQYQSINFDNNQESTID